MPRAPCVTFSARISRPLSVVPILTSLVTPGYLRESSYIWSRKPPGSSYERQTLKPDAACAAANCWIVLPPLTRVSLAFAPSALTCRSWSLVRISWAVTPDPETSLSATSRPFASKSASLSAVVTTVYTSTRSAALCLATAPGVKRSRERGRKAPSLHGEAPLPGRIAMPSTLSQTSTVLTSWTRARLLEQQPVEPAQHARDLGDAADREQRAGDVGVRRRARLVPDDEPLAGGREDDVGRERVARQPQRVHARAGDRRAARLGRPDQVRVVPGGLGRAGLREAVGELARRAARHVGLAGRAVVDHLPVGHVPRRERRGVQQRRGEHGEVPGRDHAAAGGARGRVELGVVVRRQPRGADHHVHPGGERCVNVAAHDVGL